MRTASVLFALPVVALLTASAVAQEGKKQKGKGVPISPLSQAMLRMEQLTDALKTLDLNEEQKEKLAQVKETVEPKMTEVVEKIGEVIGEENMKAYKEAAEKAKAAGKKGRQLAVDVEAAVKLTDEQKGKLDEIAKEAQKVVGGMRKKVEAMLTDEQKEKLQAAMTPPKREGKKKADK
ncbi:MAG: hypothetical protein FJ276_28080 [Planctomycetes bacterium]|nr:hypothetical protein [Planctomycetota bacterium]